MRFWPLFLRNFTYSLIVFGCAGFVLLPFVEKDKPDHHTVKNKQIVKSHVKHVDVKTKITTTNPNTTKINVNSEVQKKATINVASTKVNIVKQEVKSVPKQEVKTASKQEVKPVVAKQPVKTVPAKKPQPVVKQSAVKKAYGYHRVAQGENLWRIAQKYGTSAAAIAYANHIHNYNSISAGQTLIIPVKK